MDPAWRGEADRSDKVLRDQAASEPLPVKEEVRAEAGIGPTRATGAYLRVELSGPLGRRR